MINGFHFFFYFYFFFSCMRSILCKFKKLKLEKVFTNWANYFTHQIYNYFFENKIILICLLIFLFVFDYDKKKWYIDFRYFLVAFCHIWSKLDISFWILSSWKAGNLNRHKSSGWKKLPKNQNKLLKKEKKISAKKIKF